MICRSEVIGGSTGEQRADPLGHADALSNLGSMGSKLRLISGSPGGTGQGISRLGGTARFEAELRYLSPSSFLERRLEPPKPASLSASVGERFPSS